MFLVRETESPQMMCQTSFFEDTDGKWIFTLGDVLSAMND